MNYKISGDIYKKLNKQLVECKKARDFNQKFLDEYIEKKYQK